MRFTFHDTLIFFTGILIPTYNILAWVVPHVRKAIKRFLIRTEREAQLYQSYKEKAMRSKEQ